MNLILKHFLKGLTYSAFIIRYLLLIGFLQSLTTASIGLWFGVEDNTTSKMIFWFSFIPAFAVLFLLHFKILNRIILRVFSGRGECGSILASGIFACGAGQRKRSWRIFERLTRY
jgi:hypothetical protein